MSLSQNGSLFASLRDIRDAVEQKLRALAGPPSAEDLGRLRALELALEELNVLWEDLKAHSDRLTTEGKRYADLFEFAPDAYVATDPYGTILEANRAAVLTLLSDGITELLAALGWEIPGIKQVFYGIVLLVVVMFLPHGIWPTLARKLKIHA